MAQNPLGMNQGTNSFINFDLQGTVNTQVVNLGTISGNLPGGSIVMTAGTLASLPNLPQGSINVTAGTITAGSIIVTNGTVASVGTIPGLGSISNIGSLGVLNAGTITQLNNGSIAVTAGTGIITSGSISVIAGTIATLGTLGTVGVVNNLAGGTFNIGTVVGNIASGSADSGNGVKVSGVYQGTLGTLASGQRGDLMVDPSSILDVNNAYRLDSANDAVTAYLGTSSNNIGNVGTINMINAGTLGTITSLGQLYNAGTVQNQLAGTITALQNGTITAGTINTGTLSPIPTIANVTYGTHGTTGVSVFGTLAGGTGSGAGTQIFITSLSLSIPSTGGSQDVSIGWGTNGGTFQAGTGLLVRGNFPPGGGIQKTFSPASNSGTQAQLCLFQAGAGTVDVSVSYFIAASTL